MLGNKQIISKKHIEKEIYKTFEKNQNKKKICIADFLNKLEINTLFPLYYRSIKYSFNT